MTYTDICGYEGLYKVSRIGRVLRVSRTVTRSKSGNYPVQKKVMRTKKVGNGYFALNLIKEGKSKTKYIHRLVAETFIDNPNSKDEVNHKDGNKLNNRIDNLEWVTRAENMQHAYKHGLSKSIRHTLPKSTREKIENMRRKGKTLREISQKFNISKSTVSILTSKK